MLMMMGQHIDDTNYWHCWTGTNLQKRLAPTRSIVDRVWSRITTKISSNSDCQLMPHTLCLKKLSPSVCHIYDGHENCSIIFGRNVTEKAGFISPQVVY